MISEVLIAALILGAPTPSDAQTPPPDEAPAAPETKTSAPVPETSGPTCSADERRARRAAAARERRLHRAALQVTRETLAQARDILAQRGDQAIETWQAEFRAKARARLQGTRDRDRSLARLPTPALCRALASRDANACRALDDGEERQPCALWTTLVGEVGHEPSRCAALPPEARWICAAIEAKDPAACEGAPRSHRATCEQVTGPRTEEASGCAEPFHGQRCTWTLLVRALGSGRAGCAPGTSNDPTQLGRATTFCEAAVEREPTQCPTDERPSWATATGTRNLQVEHALRVDDHEDGQIAWASLMTTTPAVCALEVLTEPPTTSIWGAAVLSTLDDQLVQLGPVPGPPAPRTLRPVCAPTLDWRRSTSPTPAAEQRSPAP
jgi:hypothetical protein